MAAKKQKRLSWKKLYGKEKADIKFYQKTYISNIIFMVKNVFKQHLKCKKCCTVLSIFYKEVEKQHSGWKLKGEKKNKKEEVDKIWY